MKVYLVRHGQAHGIGGGIIRDSERTLTDEGKEETSQVAKGIRSIGVSLDILISSPLTRAKQTAEIFNAELGGKLEVSDTLAPAVDFSRLYRFLNKFPNANEIMLVGHEPDVGDVVKSLSGGGLEFRLPFPQAAVCCVEVADLPPTMSGTIKWMITPSIICRLAKNA